MAKKAMPRAPKKLREPEIELPDSPEAIIKRQVAGIRRQLREILGQWLDGPIAKKGDDTFPLNLGDGTNWYRASAKLKKESAKNARRFELLKRAAIDASVVEANCGPGGYLPALAAAMFRIGQFSQLAYTHMTISECGKGRPTALTDDEAAEVRDMFADIRPNCTSNNQAVGETRKAFNSKRIKPKPVSKYAIECAVGARRFVESSSANNSLW